jgi:hypothetical protein
MGIGTIQYLYKATTYRLILPACEVREGAAKLRRGVGALFYLIRHEATQ